MGFTERIHPIFITITWFGQNTLANVVLGAGIDFPPLALVKNLFPKTTHHGPIFSSSQSDGVYDHPDRLTCI